MRYLVLAVSGPLAALVVATTLRACLWILGGTPTEDFTDASLFLSFVLGSLVFWTVGQVLVEIEKGGG